MGYYVIEKTAAGFHFNLEASNGEIIATSQIYSTITDCRRGVESVRYNAEIANFEDHTTQGFKEQGNPKFELFSDKVGKHRFHLKARNGEIIAASEAYQSKESCEKGIESVRKNATGAEIVAKDLVRT